MNPKTTFENRIKGVTPAFLRSYNRTILYPENEARPVNSGFHTGSCMRMINRLAFVNSKLDEV